MTFFNVVHNDGAVTVTIEQGHAAFVVHGLRDSGVLVKAINQAVAAGARTAVMFTGEIVNPKLAAKDIRRCEKGTTWRGGKFTRLADGVDGPQFRIDWENLEHITE